MMTIPESLMVFPLGYIERESQIYSHSEIVLFRWVEVSQMIIRNHSNRLGYFDKDFQSGTLYASLIHQYTANS